MKFETKIKTRLLYNFTIHNKLIKKKKNYLDNLCLIKLNVDGSSHRTFIIHLIFFKRIIFLLKYVINY